MAGDRLGALVRGGGGLPMHPCPLPPRCALLLPMPGPGPWVSPSARSLRGSSPFPSPPPCTTDPVVISKVYQHQNAKLFPIWATYRDLLDKKEAFEQEMDTIVRTVAAPFERKVSHCVPLKA